MEWSEKTRGPTLTVPSESAETKSIEKQMKDYFSFDSSDSSEVEKAIEAAREERAELAKVEKDVFGPEDKKSKDEKSLAELESEVFGGKSHPAPRSKMEKSDLAAREDEVFDRY
ncbi:hypothetical protein [Halalkalicoccus paucihalophilus]|nr:hypothetical protein [Halalkalicoccus paucihalophilus]